MPCCWSCSTASRCAADLTARWLPCRDETAGLAAGDRGARRRLRGRGGHRAVQDLLARPRPDGRVTCSALADTVRLLVAHRDRGHRATAGGRHRRGATRDAVGHRVPARRLRAGDRARLRTRLAHRGRSGHPGRRRRRDQRPGRVRAARHRGLPVVREKPGGVRLRHHRPGQPGGPDDVRRHRLSAPKPILTGIPNGFIHDGGRLRSAPDGNLYVSTGETGNRSLAQDPDSLGGKILRVTEDGKPAPGNPDPGSPIWTIGHRNVQGLAFDDQGNLWASEFGDNTWDELNLIQKGNNYGWPEVEGKGDQNRYRNPQVAGAPTTRPPPDSRSSTATSGSAACAATGSGGSTSRASAPARPPTSSSASTAGSAPSSPPPTATSGSTSPTATAAATPPPRRPDPAGQRTGEVAHGTSGVRTSRGSARGPGRRRPDRASPSSPRRSGRRPRRPCRRGSCRRRRGWPRSRGRRPRRGHPRRRRPRGRGRRRPRRACPRRRGRPSKTWRASLSLIAPSSTSACTPATSAGVTGSAVSSVLGSLARRASSPSHHLRAACGEAPAATVSSTSPSAPAPTVSRISRSVKPQSACSRARRSRGRLGQRGPQLLDPLARRRDRHQVGLGEVAVVLGVGLLAARGRDAGVLVPVPGLLQDRAAPAEDRRLAADLVADGALDRPQRVDVLGLGAGAEPARARWARATG